MPSALTQLFRAPGEDETFDIDHRYVLHSYWTPVGPAVNPNAHLYRDQERQLMIERQARDEERRNDTIRIVSRALTNLAVITGALVEVPKSSTPPSTPRSPPSTPKPPPPGPRPPPAAPAALATGGTGVSGTGGGRVSEAAGTVGQPHSIRLRPAAPRMPNSCKNDIPDKIDLVFPKGALLGGSGSSRARTTSSSETPTSRMVSSRTRCIGQS